MTTIRTRGRWHTTEYSPTYAGRFGSVAAAKQWCTAFSQYDNHAHCHAGSAYLTPNVVHRGGASALLAQRDLILRAAYH